jgi:hypothetical protein
MRTILIILYNHDNVRCTVITAREEIDSVVVKERISLTLAVLRRTSHARQQAPPPPAMVYSLR